MNNLFDKLNKQLEIKETTNQIVKQVEALPMGQIANSNDIGKLHNDLSEIMKEGKDALEELVSIAKGSERPQHFDAVAHLVKSLSDCAKAFVEIDLIVAQRRKLESESINQGSRPDSVTNIFNGNTQDILDMVKKAASKNE